MQNNFSILAIDPGSSKWGWAVVNHQNVVITHGIDRFQELIVRVAQLHKEYAFKSIILGDLTGSQEYLRILSTNYPNLTIDFIDESNSTLEARVVYFKHNPPKGLWKLVPLSFQSPPEDYDDYTAIVLAGRYLKGQNE